jgi:hypothetical protein
MAAADRHDEATACDDSIPSLRGNDGGSLTGNHLGVGKNFNLHVYASTPDQPVAVGFCQPPAGATCCRAEQVDNVGHCWEVYTETSSPALAFHFGDAAQLM